MVKNRRSRATLEIAIILATFTLILSMTIKTRAQSTGLEPPQGLTKQPSLNQTNILETEKVRIGNNDYFFNPSVVNTTRPDLFKKGKFSIFDILFHLDKQNKIELDYHFDKSMNTHIIDLIDGETNWWYETYYSGGWPENNVFRPDHYPWKPETTLRFFRVSDKRLEGIYTVWKQEIQRLKNNENTIIIPEVIIKGNSFTKEFSNVTITPHNLRNDTFQENVITAIDVILSLGEQGKIEYELQWYDSIGTANFVRSYWVEAIDNDKAMGTCGFVYEAGSLEYQGFSGNHIHLPTDYRILNSPYYVKFFWICIGSSPVPSPPIPEFSSWLILPIILTLTFVVSIYGKKFSNKAIESYP